MYRPDCPSTAIGPLREAFGARQQKIFFVHPIDSALAAEPGRNKIASDHVCPEDMGLLRRSGRVDLLPDDYYAYLKSRRMSSKTLHKHVCCVSVFAKVDLRTLTAVDSV
jgi:hypothetical protein